MDNRNKLLCVISILVIVVLIVGSSLLATLVTSVNLIWLPVTVVIFLSIFPILLIKLCKGHFCCDENEDGTNAGDFTSTHGFNQEQPAPQPSFSNGDVVININQPWMIQERKRILETLMSTNGFDSTSIAASVIPNIQFTSTNHSSSSPDMSSDPPPSDSQPSVPPPSYADVMATNQE